MLLLSSNVQKYEKRLDFGLRHNVLTKILTGVLFKATYFFDFIQIDGWENVFS